MNNREKIMKAIEIAKKAGIKGNGYKPHVDEYYPNVVNFVGEAGIAFSVNARSGRVIAC